jgi:aminoglycoside phosphotransferase (APT) family kinase protein
MPYKGPSSKRIARQSNDPDSPTQVATGLLSYLRNKWRAASLSYNAPPVAITDGWEAYTYRFKLNPSLSMPQSFSGPMVLRIYSSPRGIPRARREFVAQQRLRLMGYRVPRALQLEASPTVFGGPFLIMEHVGGKILPEHLYERPWQLFRAAEQMAACHLRLHHLTADEFPASNIPFLERRLDEIRLLIRTHGLTDLRSGYVWLDAHRPRPTDRQSILHLDFHPLNLVCANDGSLTVLDWTEVDVGDPHADVGVTRMLMDCLQLPRPTLTESAAYCLGRGVLRRAYLRAYRRRSCLDLSKLAYYRAWAALWRLCAYGRWLDAGPLSTGSKPSSVRNLTRPHIHHLCRYFEKWTGVSIDLMFPAK